MSATVSTTYGKLEGESNSDLCVFKGIPFAAPPVGARRWTAPEKPAGWQGTRDARKFGGVAPQNSMANGALAAMVIDGQQTEDCLYLNVWTPRCRQRAASGDGLDSWRRIRDRFAARSRSMTARRSRAAATWSW